MFSVQVRTSSMCRAKKSIGSRMLGQVDTSFAVDPGARRGHAGGIAIGRPGNASEAGRRRGGSAAANKWIGDDVARKAEERDASKRQLFRKGRRDEWVRGAVETPEPAWSTQLEPRVVWHGRGS